jgi:uncharacterized protein (DUF433 family)
MSMNETVYQLCPKCNGTGQAEHVDVPRLIYRGGVVYVQGCSAPIWRLEMGRRAGSRLAAIIAAFPGLTSAALTLAFAYVRAHRTEIDELIRQEMAGDILSDEEEEDDEAAFEADLDALLLENADVFRRLAQ